MSENEDKTWANSTKDEIIDFSFCTLVEMWPDYFSYTPSTDEFAEHWGEVDK